MSGQGVPAPVSGMTRGCAALLLALVAGTAWAQPGAGLCPQERRALQAFCERKAAEERQIAERLQVYKDNLDYKKQFLVALPCRPAEGLEACKARYRQAKGFQSRNAGRWINFHLYFGDTETKANVYTFILEQDLRDHLLDDRRVYDLQLISDRVKNDRFLGPGGLIERLERKRTTLFGEFQRCCDPNDPEGHWRRVMGDTVLPLGGAGRGPADVDCAPGFDCAR